MLAWLRSHKVLVFVILVVIAAAWYFLARGQQTAYDEYTVSRGDMRETLELSGEIVAAQQANLRFGAGGLLTYLGAREGDTVKKWQTIASVDSRQLQKVLEQKLNLYAIQRGTFDQTVDDNDNSVPDGDLGRTLTRLLAKNQYQLENTVKDVEYQDLSLKLARLSSPIAGILVSAPVTTIGVNVLATDVWTIVDPTSLYFSADLDETDLLKASVGQETTITLDAYPDQLLTTSIKSVAFSPTETSSGTTYEVKFTLPLNDLAQFRLGLNGTASVTLTKKDGVLTLSSAALTAKNNKMYVLVQEGKKYVEKEVTTGIESDGQVEIISGLNEGDRVYAPKI